MNAGDNMHRELRISAQKWLDATDQLRQRIGESAFLSGYDAFSAETGISPATCSRLRNGRHDPNRRHAQAILDAWGEPEPVEIDPVQRADYLRFCVASDVNRVRNMTDLGDADRAMIDLHDTAERMLAGGKISLHVLEAKQRLWNDLRSLEQVPENSPMLS